MNIFTRSLQRIGNWTVFYILVGITILSSIGSALVNSPGADSAWWSGWLQNFSTEMMGAIVTFGLFELILGERRRQEEQRFQEKRLQEQEAQASQLRKAQAERERQVQQANAITRFRQAQGRRERQAILDEMKQLDLLRGADLRQMDMSNLSCVNSDFTGAKMGYANAMSTNFHRCKMQGVDFRSSRLSNSSFDESDLRGAYLYGVGITNTRFGGESLPAAILPDGTTWSLDTDMGRFTQETHPEFRETLRKINDLRAELGFTPIE